MLIVGKGICNLQDAWITIERQTISSLWEASLKLLVNIGKRCRHEETNLLLLFMVEVHALLAQLDRAMVS